jgi:hypothetical protein
MIKKIDTLAVGMLIGIIVPAIFYYFFVMPGFKQYKFLGDLYMQMVVKMLPIFLSRCIFPNALLFFLLLWTNKANAAKGLLIVTGIATAILMIINFAF